MATILKCFFGAMRSMITLDRLFYRNFKPLGNQFPVQDNKNVEIFT